LLVRLLDDSSPELEKAVADRTATITRLRNGRVQYLNSSHDRFRNGHADVRSFQGVSLCLVCTLAQLGLPLSPRGRRHVRRMAERHAS
jgi:hypothetical protein